MVIAMMTDSGTAFRLVCVLLAVLGTQILLTSPAAATASCADLLPPQVPTWAPPRPVAALDLARLRDIGQPDSALLRGQSPLSVAPDGRRVAFVITRADPATNSYCRGLVVVDIAPGAKPHLIDRGGELITLLPHELRGLITVSGFPMAVVPRWSPDGKWIAYLKREAGITQAWLVRSDGSEALAATHSDVDVEGLAWSPDGRALLYSSRPGLLTAAAALEREGRTGFLYDDRFVPNASSQPQIRGPIPRQFFAIDILARMRRDASEAERALVDPSHASRRPADAIDLAVGPGGVQAWTAAIPSTSFRGYFPPLSLHIAYAQGKMKRCEQPACVGDILGIWWSVNGKELRFLRLEAWGRSELALYRWPLGSQAPRRVFATKDTLMGCQPVGDQLLCARDGPTMPRRIVLIDPRTGQSALIFDPNPEFDSLKLGKVDRLHWRSESGSESYGDLVLPPDHRPGQKHPLIVVQYRTKGFLRGGTGDEYPIQAFVARGFAVLSVNKPPSLVETVPPGYRKLRSVEEAAADDLKDWRERRDAASAVVGGVRAAISLGVVDPTRIGLTGLSDGSTTAWYLLINTDLFAAAAVSTCCADPKTDLVTQGIAWEKYRRSIGYPPPTKDDPEFWKPISPAMNARTIKAPILMQLADDEFRRGLEAFVALRNDGPPVEMYVFPNEHHVKWQPAHRLAIYNRNLDWFDFWLADKRDSDPAKRDQYDRWDKLRMKKTP